MSILNDLVRDVASLLFPPRCAVCGEPLARGERTVCTLCRVTAPLTGYWREADNPVVRRCWGMVPVCQASGFLFFVRASGWRRLIHGFKYRGAWRTAREMGAWYGRYLRESGLYDDVEVVVPLPLHPFKRCLRWSWCRKPQPYCGSRHRDRRSECRHACGPWRRSPYR